MWMRTGSIVTILQDNIYLPPDFVERTLAFHRDQPLSLLSYPEARFAAPPGLLLSSALRSDILPLTPKLLSIMRIVLDSLPIPALAGTHLHCRSLVKV